MTLYRNESTGDVFDTTDQDPEIVADVKARPNFHRVTIAESTIPLAEWHPGPKAEDVPVQVSSAMDNDLVPAHQAPSVNDAAGTGEAGSKAAPSPRPAAPGEVADKDGEGTGKLITEVAELDQADDVDRATTPAPTDEEQAETDALVAAEAEKAAAKAKTTARARAARS